MDSLIEEQFENCSQLLKLASANEDLALQNITESILQKWLAICAASHFETALSKAVEAYYEDVARLHTPAVAFVRNRAIKRHYHTWFDWDTQNANAFFSSFGSEFKKFMKEKIDKDGELEDAIKSFMEIGKSRNDLIHEDIAEASFDKTMEEVYRKYISACKFIDSFPKYLREFAEKESQNS